MRRVRIGDLKSHLSGETPIAEIIPVRDRPALSIRMPAPGAPPLNRVPLPKWLGLKTDIVELLLEERQNHR